jgi:hypothetical protein
MGPPSGLAAYVTALTPNDTASASPMFKPSLSLEPGRLPRGFPDEVAIVAYETEEAYAQAKLTPQGAAYTASHWKYFDMDRSRSQGASPLNMTLLNEVPVDLLGLPINWQAGHTSVIIGQRLPSIAEPDFLQQFTNHIVLVRGALQPTGLDGFIAVANTNFTVVFLHWPTEQAFAEALRTPNAVAAGANANVYINPIVRTPNRSHAADRTPLLVEHTAELCGDCAVALCARRCGRTLRCGRAALRMDRPLTCSSLRAPPRSAGRWSLRPVRCRRRPSARSPSSALSVWPSA